MIVYHGSNVVVKRPQLVRQTRFLDFGYGFYTTENVTQAVSFADKVYRRRKVGSPIVSVYEIDYEAAFAACSLLRFDSPNEAWLDFVYENRMGTYKGNHYELIYGAVANDDVYETFNLFTAGVLDREDTIKRLKVKELYNQLVLTSENALTFLKFKSDLGGGQNDGRE
ncbi:MAG: DUF3990 domain-containing protein [Clostridiales Family XIII bacterium]|jgi:hypothetical protein|nr:DUF3990 domain-containing protein [Clostridiales Family XIII bacterium]